MGKTQKLGPGAQPFSTTSVIQALCLCMGGVPFADNKWPCKNEYHADKLTVLLKKRGVIGKINLLDAAKEMIRIGQRGTVRYIFKQTKELPGLLKIFNDQQSEIETPKGKIDATKLEAGIMAAFAKGDMTAAEALLRIRVITLKYRTPFVEMWQELPGILLFDNIGPTTTREGTVQVKTKRGTETRPCTIVSGAGPKGVSTNASPETLRRLGLA